MTTLLWIITGLTLIGLALILYGQYKDPFHPGIIITPLLIYQFSVSPILLNLEGGLFAYYSEETFLYTSLVYYVTLWTFYLGFGVGSKSPQVAITGSGPSLINLPPVLGRKLLLTSAVLGAIVVVTFWMGLENVGGFFAAYSQAKGGGHHSSGYLGEAVLLSFPALIIGAVALRGCRLKMHHAIIAVIIASPHLIQGTFGGRRGPLFLILVILFLSWIVQTGKRVSFLAGLAGITFAGFAGIIVWSQRKLVYLGSTDEANFGRLSDFLIPDRVQPGDTYLFGTTSMVVADFYDKFYWGYRYFVTLCVRPIPKQLWPTKYEDVGADWLFLKGLDQRAGLYQVAGYSDTSGYAMPSIADGYLEFKWGVAILFFVLGWALARIWMKHRTVGGFWTILYLATAPLTIYIATQSVTAFLVRAVIIWAVVLIVWYCFIRRHAEPPVYRNDRGSVRMIHSM